jgi:hypothetical protein
MLCVVVRKAHRVPSELLPLIIFDETLWITLFIAVILIGIIWSLLRLINNRIRRPFIISDSVHFYMNNYNLSHFLAHQSMARQYAQIFIDSCMLFLSIPMRRLTRAQYERVFISSVCLVSIIFVSIYQSGLATVFVRPVYFKDIDTLDKLDKSKSEIVVKYSGYMTDVFSNDSSQTFRNLQNRMRVVETDVPALKIVTTNERTATITRKSTTLLDNQIYFMRKELYLIDKECPKNYHLAYMVPIRSVYLKRINKILVDIQRFGFINKWISEFSFKYELVNRKNYTHTTMPFKTLSLHDLKFPFYTLMLCNLICMFVAAIEILSTTIERYLKRFKYIY